MRIMSVEAADPAGTAAQLLPGETVDAAFRSASAAILFTSRRILTVRHEVVLSERTRTTSYSYRALRHFSVLVGDPSECGDEIILMLGAEADSLHLRALPGTEFKALEQLLAEKLI